MRGLLWGPQSPANRSLIDRSRFDQALLLSYVLEAGEDGICMYAFEQY